MVAEPKERIKALFDKGSDVTVNRNIPVHRYFRSGQGMISMANTYYDEKQYEDAYLLFAKFITLFFEKIRGHPQYKTTSASARSANKKSLKQAFDKAENIKAILTEIYNKEFEEHNSKLKRVEEIRRKHEENERLEAERRIQKEEDKKREQDKREMEHFEEQLRRKELEIERLKIAAEYGTIDDNQDPNSLIPTDFAPPPPVIPAEVSTAPPIVSGPTLPPQAVKPTAPPIPVPQASKPVIDRSLKPCNNETKESETISSIVTTSTNKYGLRTVVCPSDLPEKFLKYSEVNSNRNVETCGVIFGNLSKNVFVISHVLLPHQTGAPDSCNTTREEDMWEFQEQHNSICLGWIHTHPSQTAFLSSVDLHTQYPYQCLMSESVAIVCSVKFSTVGYFMLSPHVGMPAIGKCTKPGFHPHQSNPPLFESCEHVQVSSSHTINIVDWRLK